MSRRRLIAAGTLVAAALATVAIVRGGGTDHVLRATFPSAVNLVPGAEVRAGGVRVGAVRSIAVKRGAAELELAIDDERLWPLREGTRARIRLGGTVAYANRYVELELGVGRPLRDGVSLPAADAASPFEFDQVLNVFDRRTRAGLGSLIDRGAVTLGPRGTTLRRAVSAAGLALDETAATLERVGADPRALQTLVRAGATTAGALAQRDARLRVLVDDAASALTEVASNERDVRRTLSRLPVALRAGRRTLGNLDRSLTGVDALVGDIRPGAHELRLSARPLAGVVDGLRDVAPSLERTLARVQRSGPGIARFLDDARPVATRLTPILNRVAPMAACLRAYSPELAAYFSIWQSPTYDASGRYVRVNPQGIPILNGTSDTSEQAERQFPQLRYAPLRPPGMNAGQPWFVDSCGARRAALDASNDPEARP